MSCSQQATKRCSRVGCRSRCPGCPPPSYTNVRLKKKHCISHGRPEAVGHLAFLPLSLSRIRYGYRSLTRNAVPHGWRHGCHQTPRKTKPTSHWPKSSSSVRDTPIGASVTRPLACFMKSKLHFPGCLGGESGGGAPECWRLRLRLWLRMGSQRVHVCRMFLWAAGHGWLD